MIGRLRGDLVEASDEEVILDVGGVGYIVRCGVRALSQMPPLGSNLILLIESQTREDGTKLYGFLTRDERRAFTQLIGVQGVGPKAALAVLDVLPPAELAAAVAREDKTMVARAQGVGPKLALRIVVELKGKALLDSGTFAPTALNPASTAAFAPPPSQVAEAIEALMGLGINEANARRAVETAKARLSDDADLSALIRAALQEIGR